VNELRKRIWHEAIRDAIGSFFSKHPDLGVPLTIECLDMKEATPIGESGHLNSLPRLLHLEIRADERGNPSWTILRAFAVVLQGSLRYVRRTEC
jgi:hypothetical protein